MAHLSIYHLVQLLRLQDNYELAKELFNALFQESTKIDCVIWKYMYMYNIVTGINA